MKSLSMLFVLAFCSVVGMVGCIAQSGPSVESEGSAGGGSAASDNEPNASTAPDEQVGQSKAADAEEVCSHCPEHTGCCIEAGPNYYYAWCAEKCVWTN
jgi:hypothetical protein